MPTFLCFIIYGTELLYSMGTIWLFSNIFDTVHVEKVVFKMFALGRELRIIIVGASKNIRTILKDVW